MKTIGIIPSRYGSTRFPGKSLAFINGKPMIERVYNQAKKCNALHRVVVATDDERIAVAVAGFGGEFVITSTGHPSGTTRIGEAMHKMDGNYDVVVNIQGDEPFLQPAQINQVIGLFNDPQTQIGTLIKRIDSPEEIANPNVVKAVTGRDGQALYFSRSAIPYPRSNKEAVVYFKHIGIYAYRADVLQQLVALPPGRLEAAEVLEQLRWLENGFDITTAITEFETLAVDTPEDIKRIVDKFGHKA